MRERNVINEILLNLPPNQRMFRNNCGMADMPNGGKVKYGVCNPGGSDLIGWTSVEITPEMVGQKVAVFTAIEVKTGKVRVSPAQKNFLQQVQAAGGKGEIIRRG